MNARGNPATLRAAQPGNRNAMKTGVYSRRARTERVAEIRAAAEGISTLELAVGAIREERARLDHLREALDADIEERGPSTRSGAAREQVALRSSVVRQLERLEASWATGEPIGSVEIDGLDRDAAADRLRDELLRLFALRDLLDLDLEQRGVSTRKGGSRGQVGQRVRVSRDVLRLADRIRTETRRARNTLAPLTLWEVAREIALDPSQRPSDTIVAIEHLLTHTAPPPPEPPELVALEAEARAMSEGQIDAALAEFEASERASHPDLDEAASPPPRNEEPSTNVDALTTTCLEILRRIGDGVDPRATARDRMRAAELREHHLPAPDKDAYWEEIESWTHEELALELKDLIALDEETR
jgi:hypothetical protein